MDTPAQSVDEIILAAGSSFGRYQLRQALLNCGAWAIGSATLLLPNLLYPRLREAWPEISDAETAAVSSLFFAGNFIGLAAFGSYGDTYGRRPAALYSLVLLVASAIASFACTGIRSFAVVRALVGFAVGGLLNSFFLLQLEQSAPADRMKSKIVLAICGWSTGSLWLVAVAYWVRHLASWRYLALYVAPAAPLLLGAYFELEESPRYLLTANRPEEALAVLRRLARTNGRPLPTHTRLAPVGLPSSAAEANGDAAAAAASAPPQPSKLRSFRELLHPTLRARSLLIAVAWWGSTCAYYGAALGASAVSGGGDAHYSIYVRNALANALEIPAYALMGMADVFGRRRTWAAFLSVAAIPQLLLAILATVQPRHTATATIAAGAGTDNAAGGSSVGEGLLLAIALAARFGATGASSLVYVAASEQWPTSCRNLGVNLGAACGRIGSILAPLMLILPCPSAVLGAIGLAAALAVLALPETRGKAVPETVGAAAEAEAAEGAANTAGGVAAAAEATDHDDHAEASSSTRACRSADADGVALEEWPPASGGAARASGAATDGERLLRGGSRSEEGS